MKLIADSGSSKTDWMIYEGGITLKRFTTTGINPCILDYEQIKRILVEEFMPQVQGWSFNQVDFYGAGCKLPFSDKIVDALREVTACENIMVESDMLGAARMCSAGSEGIVCILGTGSNSCLFDGEKIVSQTPSLGYILGDEGSGGALGKRLLNYVFKGALPENILHSFMKKYQLKIEDVILKVYREERPNKFLATFTYFLKENIEKQEIMSLVEEEFNLFITRNILPYGRKDLPIHFVGSVAYHFQEILKHVVEKNGMKLGKIESHPLDSFCIQMNS